MLKTVTISLLWMALLGAAWGRQQSVPLPQPGKAIAKRFATQSNGKVVLDRLTGLHWQQGSASKQMMGDEAVLWCTNNTSGLPGTGWRLPTIRELWTIVDRQELKPAVDPVFVGTANDYYWSSTFKGKTDPKQGVVWLALLAGGYGNFTTIFEIKSVRCVR